MISAATCSVVFCMTTTRTACMCMRCLWRIKWRRAIPFKPQRFSLTEVLPYIKTFLRMFLFLTPKIAIIRLPVQSKGEKVSENKELGKLKERPLLWERGADFAPVQDEHDNTLFIEMTRDGSYWNVNSAGIFRNGYSNKKKKRSPRPNLSNRIMPFQTALRFQLMRRAALHQQNPTVSQPFLPAKLRKRIILRNKEARKRIKRKGRISAGKARSLLLTLRLTMWVSDWRVRAKICVGRLPRALLT